MPADDNTDTRRCSKCRQLKPLDDFGKDVSRPKGRGYVCCACRHPDGPRSIERATAKLMRKVNKDGPTQPHMDTPCWVWTGANDGSKGYGRISRSGKLLRSHRVFYEMANGPIPAGPFVCHACDNPSCVRPDHLWVGDRAANIQDMVTKGRGNALRGEKQHLAKLTESTVRDIRAALAGGEMRRMVARRYGMSESAIGSIARRESWAHVSESAA